MDEKVSYRADIDGLRAIAVLSVLLYHAEIKPFTGGFVGVDVFFVISGYLITGLIVKEILANEFSLVTFYERRIRRIIPAFFAVIIFVGITGWLLFDPETYKEIGKSIVAASLSLSNIFFWSQAGYFDKPSLLKPLLHAWSLSVEEQFYLVLPLLLLIINRFIKNKFVISLVVLFIASFALNIYELNINQDSAYYFAHLRAWELALGGLISLKPIKVNSLIRNILTIVGFTLIGYSVVTYSSKTLFPGIAALLPVLGSGLIINSGVSGKSIIGRILSTPPLVFIGKISYSLYLWHWPFIVFGRYFLIRKPTPQDTLIFIAIIFILSVLSWKYIETPFRSKNFLPRPKIFLAAGSVLTLIITLGIVINLNQGFTNRFDTASELKKTGWNSEAPKWADCMVRKDSGVQELKLCNIGKDSKSPTFLLWGDSHAEALATAINNSSIRAGATGYLVTMMGCPPLLGIDRQGGNQVCYQYNKSTIEYVKAHPEIKTIILAGRWAISADGTRYKTETGPLIKLVDINKPKSKNSNAVLLEIGLSRTVSELLKLKREIIIVSEIPEIGYNVPSAYYIADRTGRDLNNIIAPTFQEYLERNSRVISAFDKIREKYNAVQFIDPTDLLCNSQKCLVVMDNIPLYFDDNHLSTYGSSFVSQKFDAVFNPLVEK